MKRLFSYLLAALYVATLAMSCSKDGELPPEHSMLATIVDGSWATGNFYVKFDNGEKAFVENSSSHTIKGSSYIDGETRAVITFTYVDGVTRDGFDHVINILYVYQSPTSRLLEITSAGISDVTKYDSGLTLDMGFVANDFINLAIKYPCSAEMAGKHDVKLVYNSNPRNSVYKDMYDTDDSEYLYLELYHDDLGDKNKTSEYSVYQCYKLSMSPIDINVYDYKGIKVIYKSLSDNSYKVFPIKL